MARKKSAPSRSAGGKVVSDQLREFVTARDLTDYQLGKLAGVDPGLINRFMRRERDPSGPTIDRLCEALGLGLVATAKGRGRPSAARPDDPTPARARRGIDRPCSDIAPLSVEGEGPAEGPGGNRGVEEVG